jgi:hypothetical protein
MTSTPDLEKKILALALRPADRFLDLGDALKGLKDNSREDYRRVVEKAGLGTRKAYYLVSLAKQFHCTPGKRARPHQTRDIRARLHQIGWTKAQVISRHLSGTNILKLLKYAENKKNNTKALEAYAGGLNANKRTKCVLLYFTPNQYSYYEKAVLKLRARKKKRGRGLVGKEKATIIMAKKVLAD